jgi:PPOX class probable F420-dependent enzyme
MPGYGVLGPHEGSGLLPWGWATERLTRSRTFWLATVRPDGRPHVTPVWGVWQEEDSLWFSCSRRSRKSRNLAVNPAAAATTDDPANPVVVEGEAMLVTSRDAIAAFAAASDTKYGTDYGVDFFADPANACFRLGVVRAFGLSADDFTGSPTTWELSP